MDWRTIALLAVASAASAQDYIGSKACASCHRKLHDDYGKTAMGRSMSAANPSIVAEKVTVSSAKLGRRFEVWAENGRMRQSESGEAFRAEFPVEFAIGSGVNGFSYIVRRGDHLFQAPLSYYSRAGKWDLSPGYEHADYGFNRPIHAACISCHSGRPQPVPRSNGRYFDPPFLELAIGCENCHGPGNNHVASGGAKSAIVNPAKLPASVAEDICMNCHQGGDTRILQPGRTELDFRPGAILNDTVAIFKIPRTRESPRDTDLLEHHESMRLSLCFRASGRMTCLTCHNPHATKTDYSAKCLSCHTGSLGAKHPARSSECAGCHMPKRDVGLIAHSALTNHRIVRTPGQGLPDAAFKQTTPDLPDLVHFNRVARKRLPALTLLQAYGQLIDRQPSYHERFQALLDDAAKSESGNPLVLAAIGRRYLRAGALDDAVRSLNLAIERGSVASTTYEDLGDALSRAGRLEEAVAALRKGIKLAPFTPVLYKSLALRLIRLQRYSDAKQTLERHVELFPEDDFVRRLLAQVSTPR